MLKTPYTQIFKPALKLYFTFIKKILLFEIITLLCILKMPGHNVTAMNRYLYWY